MENFTQFIISLAEDQNRLDALIKDPDSILETTNLTYAEKALIKSGEPELIRSAIMADLSRNEDKLLDFPEILVSEVVGPDDYKYRVFTFPTIVVKFPIEPPIIFIPIIKSE